MTVKPIQWYIDKSYTFLSLGTKWQYLCSNDYQLEDFPFDKVTNIEKGCVVYGGVYISPEFTIKLKNGFSITWSIEIFEDGKFKTEDAQYIMSSLSEEGREGFSVVLKNIADKVGKEYTKILKQAHQHKDTETDIYAIINQEE